MKHVLIQNCRGHTAQLPLSQFEIAVEKPNKGVIVVNVEKGQRQSIIVGDASFVDFEMVYAVTRKDVSQVKTA